MKVSGIVRKLDELGRVVIPKEIRRTLNLSEGSDIEITLVEGQLVLKKFSRMQNIRVEGEKVANSLWETVQQPCLLTDSDKVIFVCGGKKEVVGGKLEPEFGQIRIAGEFKDLPLADGRKIDGFVAPVFCQGFWSGSIVVLGDVGAYAGVISFAANFLSGLLV